MSVLRLLGGSGVDEFVVFGFEFGGFGDGGEDADGEKEDCAEYEGTALPESGSELGREEGDVDDECMEAAEAEGIVVHHAGGGGEEDIAADEEEHEESGDHVSAEDSEVEFSDVFGVPGSESGAGGPEDIDPSSEDAIGGGDHAAGEDEEAAEECEVPECASPIGSDDILNAACGHAGDEPFIAEVGSAREELNGEHTGECDADEAAREPDEILFAAYVSEPVAPVF
jgi:hypothetical protein